MGVVAINAIKEQQTQIEKLRETVKEQQAQIEELRRMVCDSNRTATFCRERK
jgi:hypothetical protein